MMDGIAVSRDQAGMLVALNVNARRGAKKVQERK